MDIIVEPKIGDHLVSPRTGYTHHGIYIGDGNVIHYSGLSDGLEAGPIEETTLDLFSNGCGFTIRNYTSPRFKGRAVIERARSRLGEKLYCVYSNNCEHFCQWCINGAHDSNQIQAGTLASTGFATTLAGATARSIALSEAVATTGAVGVGTAASLGLLSTIPAVGMAYGFNKTVLKDSPAFNEPERESRTVGRTATYVGATVGTAGSLAAVSASGTVAGLSSAGIATGLTAIGGGSIAAGAALAVATPIAAAAALGYGTYRLVKYLKK